MNTYDIKGFLISGGATVADVRLIIRDVVTGAESVVHFFEGAWIDEAAYGRIQHGHVSINNCKKLNSLFVDVCCDLIEQHNILSLLYPRGSLNRYRSKDAQA